MRESKKTEKISLRISRGPLPPPNREGELFVATVVNGSGKRIGRIEAMRRVKSPQLYVEWVEMSQEGRGLGTRAMSRFEREMKKEGVEEIHLSDATGKQFWRNLGYRPKFEGYPDKLSKQVGRKKR